MNWTYIEWHPIKCVDMLNTKIIKSFKIFSTKIDRLRNSKKRKIICWVKTDHLMLILPSSKSMTNCLWHSGRSIWNYDICTPNAQQHMMSLHMLNLQQIPKWNICLTCFFTTLWLWRRYNLDFWILCIMRLKVKENLQTANTKSSVLKYPTSIMNMKRTMNSVHSSFILCIIALYRAAQF